MSAAAPQPRDEDRALFYERFADEFDSRMNQYEVGKRLRLVFDIVLGDQPLHSKRFLDAGCGTGLFSRAARERGADVTSMDVGEALLQQVAMKTDSTRVVGDLLALPFPDRSFDIVLCTEVIEHTYEPSVAIAELARVTAAGGMLIVTTPNAAWHWAIRVAQRARLRPYEGFEHWVSWKDLARWMQEHDLDITARAGFNAVPFVHPRLYALNDSLDRYGDRAWGRYMINMLVTARRPRPAEEAVC